MVLSIEKIDFVPVGVIFDFDDTLLNNKPEGRQLGLHEEARLIAIHETGAELGVDHMANLSIEDNFKAFAEANAHILEAAVWKVMVDSVLVDDENIDYDNRLLKSIVERKDEIYAGLLNLYGEEIAGASRFIRALGKTGIGEKLAIASSANESDIGAFINRKDIALARFFPEAHIKARHSFHHPKPDPEVYSLAFESLGLPEADRPRVIIFEDDPRCISSAREAGFPVFGIASRFSVEQLMSIDRPPITAKPSYNEYMQYFGLH